MERSDPETSVWEGSGKISREDQVPPALPPPPPSPNGKECDCGRGEENCCNVISNATEGGSMWMKGERGERGLRVRNCGLTLLYGSKEHGVM